MYTLIYVLSSLFVIAVVLAVWLPGPTRLLLEFLGLWDFVNSIKGPQLMKILRVLGQVLLVIAALLIYGVIKGRLNSLWLLPALQAIFFGIALWFIGHPTREEKKNR